MRQNFQEARQEGGAGVDGAEVAVKVIPPSGEPSVGGPFPAAPGPGFRAEADAPDLTGGLGRGQLCRNHRSACGRERACGGQDLRAGVVQLAFAEQAGRRDIVQLRVHALEPGVYYGPGITLREQGGHVVGGP